MASTAKERQAAAHDEEEDEEFYDASDDSEGEEGAAQDTPASTAAATAKPAAASTAAGGKRHLVAGATMPGMPRACCGTDWTTFRVRKGPNYRRNLQKAPSRPQLFEILAQDFFSTEAKTDHLCRFIKLPPIPRSRSKVVKGVPPIFVINCLLPNYDPPNPLWGTYRDDGPGFSFVSYYLMKKETQKELESLSDKSRPAVKLLHKWFHDDELKVRLKMMLNLLNIEDLDVNFAVRRILIEYNQKPVLTRPQHRFYTDHQTYFEIVIDTHLFSYLGRKTLSVMRPVIAECQGDYALVIEGHSDDELPENIAVEGHFHGMRYEDATPIDIKDLQEISNADLLEILDDEESDCEARAMSDDAVSISSSGSLLAELPQAGAAKARNKSPAAVSLCSECGERVDLSSPVHPSCPHLTVPSADASKLLAPISLAEAISQVEELQLDGQEEGAAIADEQAS